MILKLSEEKLLFRSDRNVFEKLLESDIIIIIWINIIIKKKFDFIMSCLNRTVCDILKTPVFLEELFWLSKCKTSES